MGSTPFGPPNRTVRLLSYEGIICGTYTVELHPRGYPSRTSVLKSPPSNKLLKDPGGHLLSLHSVLPSSVIPKQQFVVTPVDLELGGPVETLSHVLCGVSIMCSSRFLDLIKRWLRTIGNHLLMTLLPYLRDRQTRTRVTDVSYEGRLSTFVTDNFRYHSISPILVPCMSFVVTGYSRHKPPMSMFYFSSLDLNRIFVTGAIWFENRDS